ncbi:hypothetical protein RN001_015736 [Aquatica leii]|uniref:Vitellogenin domain-containing protein n=1 Tax=Aquatica leii TaxID=1421715 RepID=A0AAN7PND9_9COLE|nr:hypothetical protein RN001_015736 [Aquatica leii]
MPNLINEVICRLKAGGYAEKLFQCSRYHKEKWSKFGYEVGDIYIYNYTGLVKVSVSEPRRNEETELLFTVEVAITSNSPFDYMMQLSNPKFEEFYVYKNNVIKHSLKDNYVTLALSKHPLHFSFQNGRIDTICPGEEQRDILHIKKAILSSFQNSMPNFDKDAVVYETDINGICETRYQIVGYNGSNFLVYKTKNLDACSHRKLHYLPWVSTSNFRSTESKSASLLKSSHFCIQTFNKHFILQSTNCSEEHLFQPFSNRGNGATTRLHQNLVFIKTTRRNENPMVPLNYKRKSLLFDHKQDQKLKEYKNTMVLSLLHSLEKKSTNGIDQDVPKIFSHLVHELQKMTSDFIYEVFKSIKHSSRKRKFLLDALPLLTTVEGVVTMKILHQQGEILDSQVNSWLTSLAFIKEVSLPIIGELTSLLRIESIRQKAILSTTSLIYSYCKDDLQCLDKAEIKKALKIIEMPLLSNCIPISPENHKEILLSLKGIGNMGFSHSLNYLRTCYSNNDSPIELRITAIAAHRRISCAENNNLDQLENYFSNTRQNSEIRIAAYLTSMQCASYATFARVKDVLRREETNQVGSFIWTHITNLQETSSKWKQSLKHLVENEFLRNKFSTDFRKYSRNYEMSTFFETLSTGATIESNVIFTSESYLPKSLMLNLTLDLFGEPVNIFEVGARMEGYEEIIENLFGPEGYFPEESLHNALESFRNNKDETDKIQELRKSFETKTIYKEPNGLFYAKIFGNEIFYTQFKDFEAFIDRPLSSRSILDYVMKFFRQQDVDYTKAFLFLDTSYRIPTLLGFPLELTVNGTATIGLTVTGKVDLKNMWMHKMGIEGRIYASTAVDVIGTMQVDYIVSKTGLRSISSLNSNLYLDGHAFIDQGKFVDLKFNVPKNQIKIINIESQVFLIQGENSYAMKDISDNVENWQKCTQQNFNDITGFKLCSGLHYVNSSSLLNVPYFPFSGKFIFFLDAQKIDNFDNYQLNLKIQKKERNYRPVYSMLLYFDTPNSKLNRKIETSYHLDCEKLTFNTKLASPFVNWELDTKIGSDHDNLGFVLQTKSNNHETLLVQLSLVSNLENNTWTYEPLVMFKYKNVQIAAISGKIHYLRGQKYNANLVFDGFTRDPIEILGDLYIGIRKCQLTGSIKSNEINGNTRVTVVRKFGSISFVAKTTYDYTNFKDQTLDFSFKYHTIRKITITEDTFYLCLNSTQLPSYNALLSLNIYKDNLYFENVGILVLFQETWQTHQLFKFARTDERDDIALQCSLTCVQKHIDYDLNLSYIKSDLIFKIHALVQLSYTKRIEMLINYNGIIKNNQTFDFLLYFPKQEWTARGVFGQKTKEKYHFYLESFYEITDKKESVLNISGNYINSTTENSQNHSIIATINTPLEIGTLTPWIIELSFQKTQDLFLTTSELRINNNLYKSTIAVAQNGFSGLLQINNKRPLLIHGAKNDEDLTGFVSLNIYQHFEASINMKLPCQNLQIILYWDKDKDINKKLSLLITSDIKKGLYMADLEYPRQKITAFFVLLPTQVTMNVSWGIDHFQKVYLKAGNKLYDIGGIWFAKLETPLKHLESQEFQLSYYLLPDNVEFKVDVSWQNQSVNVLLSGIKSESHMSGYFDVNTTIPEIFKIGFAVRHYRKHLNGVLKIKNDGTAVFNNHQIIGQSLWQSEGLNVSTSFHIVSSGLFSPIQGSLLVHKNKTTQAFNSVIKWKNTNISAEYNIGNQKCQVRVTTPFRGFEITDFKYVVSGDIDKLLLEMEINVFKRYNYAFLSWSSEINASLTELSIISPLVGSYQMKLGHSTKYGHLNNFFVITQESQNEILAATLEADFISILNMNLTANLKFLIQEASVTIKNVEAPFNLFVTVYWNEQYIKNELSILTNHKRTTELDWNLSSTLLSENATCKYLQNDNTYLILIELPKHLKFKNMFTLKDFYKNVDNVLNIETALKNWSFHYYHSLSPNYRNFDSELFFSTNHNDSRFIFKCNFDDNFPNVAYLQLNSPLHKPLLLNFSLVRNSENTWNPHFYVKYNDDTIITAESYAYLNYLNSTLDICFSFSNYHFFNVQANYDFRKNPKTANVVLSKENTTLQITSKFVSQSKRGSLTFDVTILDLEIKKTLVFSTLLFNLNNHFAKSALEIVFPEHEHNLQLTALVITSNSIQQSNTTENENKIDCNLPFIFNSIEEYFSKEKNLTNEHCSNPQDESVFHGTKVIIQSTFNVIKNNSLSAFYYETDKFRNFSVLANVGNHNITVQSYYNISTQMNKNEKFSEVYSTLNAEYHNSAINNTEPFRIDMQMLGKSTGFKFLTHVYSNLPYFENIHVETMYKNLNYGHSLEGNLSYNGKHYYLYEQLRWENNSRVVLANVSTPLLSGSCLGKIVLGDRNYITINTRLKNLSQCYHISIVSEYESFLNTSTIIYVTSPNATYKGKLTNFITSTELNSKVVVTTTKNKNFVEAKIKYPSLNKILVTLNTMLPNTEYPVSNTTAIYNFNNINKTLLFQIQTNYGYNLDSVLDIKKMRLVLSTPSNNNALTIFGKHHLNSMKDFSIFYNASLADDLIQINILHQFDNSIKTKVDVQTTFTKWKNISFQQNIDDEIFEAQLYFGDQKAELEFIKNFVFCNRVLLVWSEKYSLSMSSGKENCSLIMSTPWMVNKINVNYAPSLKQFAFVIFQDEKTLLNVVANTTKHYDQFKTKETTTLFLKYVDFTIFLNYGLPQFNFLVTKNNKTTLSAMCQLNQSMFVLNISSNVEEMQTLYKSTNLVKTSEINLIKKQHGLEKRFNFVFAFCPDLQKAEFTINLPRNDKQYLLTLSLGESFLTLHAKTPFDQWKELVILTDQFLNGQIQVKRNETSILGVWALGKKNHNVTMFFKVNTTNLITLQQWEAVVVNGTLDREKFEILFKINNINLDTSSLLIDASVKSVKNTKLFLKYENQNTVYKIDSKIKIDCDNKTVKMLLTKNNHTNGVILQNQFLANQFRSNLNLFYGKQKFDFKIKNIFNKSSTLNNCNSKVFFNEDKFHLNSSYKDLYELTSKILLDGYNVSVDALYVPHLFLNTRLALPFLGRVNLDTSFCKEKHSVKIDFDNNTFVDVYGKYKNDSYSVDMSLKSFSNSHNGTVTGLLNFDKSTMTVNANGLWKNNPIILNFDINLDALELTIKTPFELAKNVHIQGKCLNKLNIYQLNATGVWNNFSVEYYGEVINKNNFTVHSQLNIGELYHSLLHFDVLQFGNMKKIYFVYFYPNVLNTQNTKINFETVLSMFDNRFNDRTSIALDAYFINLLQFGGNLEADFPLLYKLQINTKIENYRFGSLTIYDNTKNKTFLVAYKNLDLEKRFKFSMIGNSTYNIELNLTKIDMLQNIDFLYIDRELQTKTNMGFYNDMSTLSVNSIIHVPNKMPFSAKLHVSKFIEKIDFCLNDTVKFYLHNSQTLSPKLQVKFLDIADIFASFDKSSFDFNTNSTMLNLNNFQFYTDWFVNSREKRLNIDFKNFGLIQNGKTIVKIKNDEYYLTSVLINDEFVFVNVSAILNGNYTQGFNYPSLNELSIQSSFLPYKNLVFQLRNNPSVLLFFGDDYPNFLEEKFGRYYILLKSWRKPQQFYFLFSAPNLQCTLVDVNVKLDVSNASVVFKNKLEIKSSLSKNLNVKTEVGYSEDGVKVNLYYMLPESPEFGFNLYLPFSFPNNFYPKMFIYGPKGNYSLYCIYSHDKDEFNFTGGYQYLSQTSNVLVRVFKNHFLPNVVFDWNLPYILDTDNSLLSQIDSVISSHLNDFGVPRRLLLIFNNTANNYFVNVALFSLNDKQLFVKLQYQHKPNTFLSAILSHPHYQLGFSFDLIFDSFKKFQMQGSVSVPSVLTTEFILKHNLIFCANLKNYELTSTVKINSLMSHLILKSFVKHRFLHFIVDTQIDKARFFTILNCEGSVFDNINFTYKLQTPIAALSDFKASLVLSKHLLSGMQAVISYNKKLLGRLDLHTAPNNFSMIFYNVLLPLSIDCRYLKSDVFELAGNICWDFDSSNSQLGGHIYLGKNISVGLTTPTRIMTLDGNIFQSSQRVHYFGRVSWCRNQEISASLTYANYSIKSKTYSKSRVVVSFPFRTFEFINALEADTTYPHAITSKVTFTWAPNSTSKMYLYNKIVPEKLISKLFVPIWKNEIILNLSLCLSKLPSYVKAHLMYSNDSNKHVYFEVFHNEDTVQMQRLVILQHPWSKINYTLQVSTNRLPYTTYGNISFLYTNYLLKRQEEIRSFLSISYERFEIYGEVETNKHYVSVLGAYAPGKYNQAFRTMLKINDKEPFTVDATYSFKETGSSISLVTSYGTERRYDLYAGFPSKRELTAKLSRVMYDKQILEGLFSVKLNTSQLLWIKVLWKSDILQEYSNMLFNEYSDLRFILESIGQELIDTLEDDLGQEFLVDLYSIRQNVSSYIHGEIQSLSNDYLNFLNELENGYKSNSFYYKYIQEILETEFPESLYLKEMLIDPFRDFFQEMFDELVLVLQDIYSTVHSMYVLLQHQIEFYLNQVIDIKKLKEDAKNILKNGIENARVSLHEMEIILIDIVEEVDQNVASIKQQCFEFFKPYLNQIEHFIVYIEQRLALFQMLVLDVLDAFQDYILNLRESKEVIKMYASYINWLEEFHITDLLEPIADVLEQTIATILNDLKKVTNDYRPYIDAIFGDYQKINALPSLVEFRQNFNSFFNKIMWIWNHHNLTTVIKSQIHQYASNFDSYLVSIIKFNNSNFENIFQSSNYIFRPDIGMIEVTQPLPVEWDAFDSLPEFHPHPLYDKIKKRVENLISIQKHHLSDIVNAIKSYIGESSQSLLSPPTNNIAMIIGDYNFITFDKKYFSFKGNCSYVLTAEFVTNSFGVEVNYELFQKYVMIKTPQATLKVFSNSTVLQNNVLASLPLINGSLIAIQEYNEIIVDYGKGLKVICNLYYNYCTIQLSGWLFGKVGGLLGTLDNDVSTDFNLPGGSKASDLEQFIQGWQVGKCHSYDEVKNLTSISPLSITLFETLCQLFFSNVNSPLASCFSIINSSPFYDICVKDMKNIKNPTMCSSIAAYRARCKYSSVEVIMPEMCIHCKYDIGADEKILDKTTPKSIDIVIIKEINCFNNVNQLAYFTTKLNKDLINLGYTNNRFSIIEYASNKPYIHLSKNKIWMQAEDLINIKLLPKIYLNTDGSISQTIEFVISNLEFRPGVSKQFLTVSCSSNHKSEDIKNLPLLFGEKDITLHLLRLNTVKKHLKNILFVRNKVTINDSIIEDLNAVVNHEQEATDVISLLALSTDGIAFHTNSGKKPMDNRVLTAFSQAISLTAKHSPCQRCKCVPNPDGTGKIDCIRCMSPIVKQLLNEYESSGDESDPFSSFDLGLDPMFLPYSDEDMLLATSDLSELEYSTEKRKRKLQPCTKISKKLRVTNNMVLDKTCCSKSLLPGNALPEGRVADITTSIHHCSIEENENIPPEEFESS